MVPKIFLPLEIILNRKYRSKSRKISFPGRYNYNNTAGLSNCAKTNEQSKVETRTPRYLEMVDEILGVYIDAASISLVRHKRQSDVDAAVVLPLVDLSNITRDCLRFIQTERKRKRKFASMFVSFFDLWLPILSFSLSLYFRSAWIRP